MRSLFLAVCKLVSFFAFNCSLLCGRKQEKEVLEFFFKFHVGESIVFLLSDIFSGKKNCRENFEKMSRKEILEPGLPDFPWSMIPKPEKMYKINTNVHTKWS
jgi:hypothetical protein